MRSRSAAAAAAIGGAVLAGLVVATAAAKSGGFPHEIFIAALVGSLVTLLEPTWQEPLAATEERPQRGALARQANGPQGPAPAQAGYVDVEPTKSGRATSGVRVRGGETVEPSRELVVPPRAPDATDVDPVDDDRRHVVGE